MLFMLPITIPATIEPQKSIRDITATQPFKCEDGLDNLEFRRGSDRVQQNSPTIAEMISRLSIHIYPH